MKLPRTTSPYYIAKEIVKKYVVKGQEIYVEGSLNYRNYDDDDGNKKYVFEIISNELLLLNK
ncbi:MAG: hypothetical protein CL832_07290 [Crocinitomicaceae bacterium]|nr:hypothetical protein [Crocinitomicaceae bacterium]